MRENADAAFGGRKIGVLATTTTSTTTITITMITVTIAGKGFAGDGVLGRGPGPDGERAAPCPLGWRVGMEMWISIGRAAVQNLERGEHGKGGGRGGPRRG